MKATANTNVKYNGTWYKTGDSFEVSAEDSKTLGNAVKVEAEKPKNVDLELKAPKEEKKKSEKSK